MSVFSAVEVVLAFPGSKQLNRKLEALATGMLHRCKLKKSERQDSRNLGPQGIQVTEKLRSMLTKTKPNQPYLNYLTQRNIPKKI